MDYLIVSATTLEIQPLLKHFQISDLKTGDPVSVSFDGNRLHFVLTGVGMMQAAYYLPLILSIGHFDHVIQIGIAGAFEQRLQIGEVIAVRSQLVGDLGAIENGHHRDVFDMGLADRNESPFQDGILINNGLGLQLHPKLEAVSALSVNQVSSDAERINDLVRKYNSQIESMEGAAFHFACLKAGISYAEIRGISNHVEVRNKENWDIQGAVEQVNNYLLWWLNERRA